MQETQINSSQTEAQEVDTVALRVLKYEEGAINYQKRRHPEWRENYSLYRDKVTTNRLEQRQSVNVPLMKETVKTVLAKVDEFPDLRFESLSGDKQKEIFINEYWNYWFKEDRMEVKDIVDKKQVTLYGRSIMKLNMHPDGRPTAEVLEPYDWLCDRFADPSDIDGTANYQAHINIFKSLSQVQGNSIYDQAKVNELATKYGSMSGVQMSDENYEALQAKNERLEEMGQTGVMDLATGETVVELREHYIKLYDEKTDRLVIHIRVTASGVTLLNKPLEALFGINFFPFTTWADDVEKTDIWSDGIGDVTRTPNKVLNAMFSQMVENRTLRNFGMTYYDSTKGDGKWIPQSYEPSPFGWYATAGNPNEVTKRVEIPDLSESMDEMNFLIGMTERATASTATEKGTKTQGDATLGEVKLMLASSNERITSMAKFYKIARREFGDKWYKFLMANEQYIEPVKLYKKSSINDKIYSETVKPSDWKDEAGYVCKVVSTAEREQKSLEQIQKIRGVSTMFPANKPLEKILKKKSLDILEGLTPEEIQEVMDYEEQNAVEQPDGATGEIPSIPQGEDVPTPELVV